MLALGAAGCGGDDEGSGAGSGEPAADGLGRGVAQAGLHEPTAATSRTRDGALLVRRLRRARRADRAGRQARRLRGRQHEAARRSCTPRGSSRSRWSSPATGSCSRCRPSDSKVASLDDLEQPGVTLAIGSESVPVGSYTRDGARQAARPPSARRSCANVRSDEPDVGGIVGKLTQGAVDAGFVYVTDVRATDGKLKAIELPRRPAADASPTASRSSRAPSTPRRPGRSSTGCSTAPGAQALEDGGLRAAARAVRRAALVRRAAGRARSRSTLLLPDAADRRDLRRRRPAGPAWPSLGDQGALDALRLSLECSAIAVAIIVVVGTPAAYLLATRRVPRARGRRHAGRAAARAAARRSPGIGLLAALGPQRHPRRRSSRTPASSSC